jgi:PEP-CTERM motif
MLKSALFAAALLAALPAAQAATLVQWDFQVPPADLLDSTTSPSVAASIGSGTASGLHASQATDWTTPAGNGSTDSFSSNTWAIGDYWQFSFSTTGYTGLSLSVDQTRSGTGPDAFKLAYSTDGGTSFVDQATYTVAQVTWTSGAPAVGSTYTFDLTGVTALDNQASVLLRLVSTVTTAAGGTNRVDNATVMATPVPEAGTSAMLLAGLAAIGFIARRGRFRG